MIEKWGTDKISIEPKLTSIKNIAMARQNNLETINKLRRDNEQLERDAIKEIIESKHWSFLTVNWREVLRKF